jgi:hypothetical protein
MMIGSTIYTPLPRLDKKQIEAILADIKITSYPLEDAGIIGVRITLNDFSNPKEFNQISLFVHPLNQVFIVLIG